MLPLVFSNTAADDTIPDAFDARYKVLRKNQHVANAHFSLQQRNGSWIWRMQSEPHGMYRWLTRKKPFTETRVTTTPTGLRLSQLSSGDYAEKPPTQSSWFDPNSGRIFYANSKKGNGKQLDLPDNLYSHHDVHLLYEKMRQSNQQRLIINFYNKGRVYESTLLLELDILIEHESKSYRADKITQSLHGENKTMVYYYLGHSLAPLKIERMKDNQVHSIMWRTSLE